jgi:uncharacterized protein (DUF1800 family)
MRVSGVRLAIVLGAMLVVNGCGGGSGGGTAPVQAPPAPGAPPPPPPAPTISNADAARFLRQATFGPTEASVARVKSLGYSGWISEQLGAAPSLELPYMRSLPAPANAFEGQRNRLDAWFRNAITGPDQLRQRVAFALSEIMVVSDRGVLFDTPNGLAYYYDTLAQNAFGNFRALMEAVTLTPAMGVYLSMLGNEKPDAQRNIRPDENYARELMQLFTIGLVELREDGTPRLDGNGQPIPTYDQSIIEGFAHVYTGWTFANSASFRQPSYIYAAPMQAYPPFHDTGAKKLLRGVVLPAGQTPDQDLDAALDNIFAHPNVGPFIGRQLIQRLVTTNPSPAYVARVARVFNDDGTGVRGNLGAVVRAILQDDEARAAPSGDAGGKLTEPLLRLTGLWRAYDARATSGRYLFANPDAFFGQAPLRAPSVFNFFRPNYAPPGEIRTRGLVSPEMEITHETTSSSVNNYLAYAIYLRHSQTANLGADDIAIGIDAELPFANDLATLVARAADRLLGGAISQGLRDEALAMANRWPATQAATRVVEVIHTIATSPEYAVLR